MQLSIYITSFCFLTSLLGWSQERNIVNDTLKSESVIIVKSYNPTINDAFKIQDNPSFEDPNKEAKQQPNYRIHSVPVASTFTPKKAKAIEVEKEKQEKGAANYARLAIGNFGNVEAEGFVVMPIDKKSQFTTHLDHQSSQGGIKEVKLDDTFYDTALQLGFDRFEKDKQFNGQLEFKHQLYNWYGLDEDLIISQEAINQIDPSHSFIDFNLQGKLITDADFFEGGTILLRHFRDDFESAENHFALRPKLRFEDEKNDLEIQLELRLEYLQNTFKSDLEDIKQSIFIGGASPNVSLNIAGADVKAGMTALFGTNKLVDENKIYIYPNLLATYKLFKYDFNMFAKITGGLDQNTYRSASAENLFVAPQLLTTPTNRVYDAKVGMNGSLLNFLGFEIYAGLKNERNYPFFLPTFDVSNGIDVKGYDYANAFDYGYGDLKTASFHGSLQFDLDRKYGTSLEVDYANYSVVKVREAWYLPEIEVAVKGYYVFTPQWRASGKLFFTGERKGLDPIDDTTQSLDSFVDLNLQIDYQINERWSAYVKGKNLANHSYERWLNYPVQTAQGLIGARYNFYINK